MDWFIWMNRIGIILNFISFWFAAPEILGENRLRQIEASFEKATKVGYTVLLIASGLVLMPLLFILFFFSESIDRIGLRIASRDPWAAIKALLGLAGLFLGAQLLGHAADAASALLDRFLNLLADDQRVRQRALILGAVLFLLGNILQFAATFGRP